ncbi:hypothetical protein B0H13DRAFT_2676237 [Mycena leptocephala]|nr:hypothetical protein B0H13DRAFT_2676237 [Mycena leptocephala]
MPIYLVRKGIPPLSLASGDICIQSALIKALQLSFYIPRSSVFHADFGTKSIRKLELIFHEELFQAASRPLDRVPYNPAVMNLFRDIVYSMSERFSGPVVIVGWQDIFSCRPRDIRRWKLHKFHFSGGLGNYIHSAFKSPRPIRTTIRLHDGASANVFPIQSIKTAHIYEIPSVASTPGTSSTLVVLNHEHITSLVLGYSKNSNSYSIPGAELSVVLPCITLPLLYTITLNTETIDPVVLSQFLARHKTLLSLEFDSERPAAPARALITPAVTLPALHRINSSSPANVVRLLDALEWSPKLSNLGFSYDRSTPHLIAGLNVLLRRLGQRTRDVQLQLVLAASNMRPLDEEESAIASTLACVRSVQMNVLRQETAREILPWLALLPRLQLLDLGFLMTSANVDERMGFVQEVRAALPADVEIVF